MILTVPGGKLSSAQLKAIAKVAAEHGRDLADLTTSREIRLLGIPEVPASEILSPLAEAGLTSQQPVSVSEEPADAQRDPIGVLEQPEAGFFTIGIPVLAGRLSAAQMRKAADVAERYGDGSLRLTAQQNLLLSGIPKDRVAQVLEGLDGVGLRVWASPVRRGLVCCSKEKGPAIDLANYLEKQAPLDEPIGIHLSDFPCGCPQAQAAQILVEGSPESCSVAAGGFTAGNVPASQVKYRIEKLLVGYKKGRKPPESFSEFCLRAGSEELSRLLSEDPENRSE